VRWRGAISLKDVEEVETALAPSWVGSSTLAILAAFAVLSALAVGLTPRQFLGMRRRRSLLSRGRLIIAGALDDLFKFTAIEPHAPAGRAHIELNAGAVERLHIDLAIGTDQQRHDD